MSTVKGDPRETPGDPRKQLADATKLREQADRLEFLAVRDALRSTEGNVRRAADLLDLPARTLDKRLREGRLMELRKETARKPGRPAK